MAVRGRIFISYRRDDAPADARGLCDRLSRTFGASNVFMDVDRLMAGQRFERELDSALGKCDVLIAVIGTRWMALLEEYAAQGRRDYVREEIAAALQKDIVVIPVLTGREASVPTMPAAASLPDNIRDLVAFQKISVAHETFRRDSDELIAAIKLALAHRYGPERPWLMIAAAAAAVIVAIVAIGYWKGIVPPHRPPDQTTATSQDVAKGGGEPGAVKRSEAGAADEAARKKATEEQATRKGNEARIVTDCDRLAAAPQDSDRADGIAGVFNVSDIAAATAACDDAMRRYPNIARFVYQAGRTAVFGNDYPKGIQLFRAAIAMESTAALSALGLVYLHGDGVPRDRTQARGLFEQGARRGDGAAMANLGMLYQYGLGVAADTAKARELYEEGAARGNAAAMASLGMMYEMGQGVRQDYGAAHDLYEKAAALGHPEGMLHLGNLFYGGRGVAQDYDAALSWFQKAAAGGERRAMSQLGRMYDLGQAVPEDPAQARYWFAQAAMQGGPLAMFYLGTLNEDGRGGPKDIDKAREWYQKALIAGYEPAREKLKNLSASGTSSGSPQ